MDNDKNYNYQKLNSNITKNGDNPFHRESYQSNNESHTSEIIVTNMKIQPTKTIQPRHFAPNDKLLQNNNSAKDYFESSNYGNNAKYGDTGKLNISAYGQRESVESSGSRSDIMIHEVGIQKPTKKPTVQLQKQTQKQKQKQKHIQTQKQTKKNKLQMILILLCCLLVILLIVLIVIGVKIGTLGSKQLGTS